MRAAERDDPALPAHRDRARRQEGLHFRERDAADLADKIARLADDAALRSRLGGAARERVVARYSWRRHCEQLEALLLRIAA
jgi:glycosyltransferase involved in cell wall biosynthesis